MENRLEKKIEHEMETGVLDLPHHIKTIIVITRIARIISNNNTISSGIKNRNSNSIGIYIYVYIVAIIEVLNPVKGAFTTEIQVVAKELKVSSHNTDRYMIWLGFRVFAEW